MIQGVSDTQRIYTLKGHTVPQGKENPEHSVPRQTDLQGRFQQPGKKIESLKKRDEISISPQ